MEDGRSRCPFNPEYKSTAIIVGMYRSIKGLEPLSMGLPFPR